MTDRPILILPGFGGSGPDHWQSLWQQEFPNCQRVEQSDWDNPDLNQWTNNLLQAIHGCGQPPLLVAHSLGCALVAHLGKRDTPPKIAGALLIAPADVDEVVLFYEEVASFAPMPLSPLPWPTMVVSSDDDVYVGPKRAKLFADSWGAELQILVEAGHINADSNLGSWSAGKVFLAELTAQADAAAMA